MPDMELKKIQPNRLNPRLEFTKMLPDYVEPGDIDKMIEAMRLRKSHKDKAQRDILLVEVDRNTGLRRAELADLRSFQNELVESSPCSDQFPQFAVSKCKVVNRSKKEVTK